eukprot:Platyproteum_vivax@DN2276_c0_g1_i2.p1
MNTFLRISSRQSNHLKTPIRHFRYKGSCTFWNFYKGYGFVKEDSTGADCFVHFSNLRHGPDYRALEQGQRVEFDKLVNGQNKLEAVDVTGPEGAPLPFAEPHETEKKKANKQKKAEAESRVPEGAIVRNNPSASLNEMNEI